MAKSIRLTEIDEQRAQMGAPLSRAAYWEHWFASQSNYPKLQASQSLDEHSIWEKAVNLEILAMNEE